MTPPLTLEARINSIIHDPQFEKELAMRGILLPEFQCDWHTFGGFERLPHKYQLAIEETERRVARKAHMTLDETKEVLQILRNRGTPRMQAAVDSALHHLEAVKRDKPLTDAELCHILFWRMTRGKCEGWRATQRKGLLLMIFDEKTLHEGTTWTPENIGDLSGWSQPQPQQEVEG